MSRTPLSRRTVLRGAGGYFIALPFLESMLAPLANAQTVSTKRFVSSFAGTIVGGDDISGFASPTWLGDPAGCAKPCFSDFQSQHSHLQLGGPVSSAPTPIDRKKSVLDLMLADANRLSASVSGKDKIRLEQHFDEIRAIERSLQNTTGGGRPTGSCMEPTDPGADPVLGANAFVGWSNETQRGNVMADMIAYAFACDLTRVVSWLLTFDQVFLRNALNNLTDMHDDSHDQSNRKVQIAASTNWHASLFARLVDNLSRMPEGSGTVLDNTFLSLVFAESKTAHGRTNMRHVVAGRGLYIKLGQHIDGGGDHPGKIQITGLQSVGVASNKLNELTGALTPLLK